MLSQFKQSLLKDTHYWVSGILIVAVLFIYGQTIRHDFIPYDDPHYIYANDRVLEGLTWENFKWSWTTFEFSNWHPLTWISMMLDVSLFGQNAGLHHMTSAFIHLINSFLVYFVLFKMTNAPWRSGFVAILFAVHPLHIESVAWASERKDVLAAFFGLISIHFYALYTSKKYRPFYLAALITFAFGLCSKPMLVTWPFLFLLLDYWPLNRIPNLSLKRNRYVLIEKIPFLAMSLIVSVLTYLAQEAAGSVATVTKFPIHVRLMNSVISYFEYMLMTLYPKNLAVIYPHIAANISTTQFLVSGVSLAIGIAVSILWIRKVPAAFVGLAWFLGVLVPVIGLVQVGGAAMADRYTYLPHIGLFVAVVWSGYSLLERHKTLKTPAFILTVLYCGALAWTANQQTAKWRNGITLFTHTIKVTPDNTKASTALGLSYARYNRHEEALDWFDGAVNLDPGNAGAHANLGTALLNLQRFEEAEKSLRAARVLNDNNASTHFYLGLAYYKQNKFEQALTSAQEALNLNPSLAEARNLFDDCTAILESPNSEQL